MPKVTHNPTARPVWDFPTSREKVGIVHLFDLSSLFSLHSKLIQADSSKDLNIPPCADSAFCFYGTSLTFPSFNRPTNQTNEEHLINAGTAAVLTEVLTFDSQRIGCNPKASKYIRRTKEKQWFVASIEKRTVCFATKHEGSGVLVLLSERADKRVPHSLTHSLQLERLN